MSSNTTEIQLFQEGDVLAPSTHDRGSVSKGESRGGLTKLKPGEGGTAGGRVHWAFGSST